MTPKWALALGMIAPFFAGCESTGMSKSDAAPMSEEEVMARWMELATPGTAHQELAKMSGSWNAELTMWMAPDAPEQTSNGVAHNEMAMGGRFLMTHFEGETPMGPFQGFGMLGYDNATQKYVGVWLDSMGTTIMPVSEGSYDESTGELVMTRTLHDPTMDREISLRDVTKWISADEHHFDMYGPDMQGNEFHTLHIVYTRQ